MESDDERLAKLSRALRRRLRRSQRANASLASIPREDQLLIEAGKAGTVRLDRIRRSFDALGATVRVSAWWQGAAADRLLDERHAALVERAVRPLLASGWTVHPEVSFSEFGERGSIDILAGYPTTRAALVAEVKASLGSVEETNRVLDMKERLASKLARERFGWRPDVTSRVLILPEDSTVRRVIEKHHETMAAVYPARSREFRAWLKQPSGRIAAIWFLSEVAVGDRIRPARDSAMPNSPQASRTADR